MPATDELIESDFADKVLTTKDNPFNPKTDYRNWRTWDERNGYNTESFVARVANVPADIDLDDDVLIGTLTTQAYYSILEHDPTNNYMLV